MADDLCEPLAMPLLRLIWDGHWHDLMAKSPEPPVTVALRIGVAYAAGWMDVEAAGDGNSMRGRLTAMGRQLLVDRDDGARHG